MLKSILVVFSLLLVSVGIVRAASKDFEYETDLKIYTTQELQEKGFMLQNADKNMSYLYGWVRLKSFPENVWTIIPRCRVKVRSKSFDISFFFGDISGEKSYILIPVGTSITDKNFDVKVTSR